MYIIYSISCFQWLPQFVFVHLCRIRRWWVQCAWAFPPRAMAVLLPIHAPTRPRHGRFFRWRHSLGWRSRRRWRMWRQSHIIARICHGRWCNFSILTYLQYVWHIIMTLYDNITEQSVLDRLYLDVMYVKYEGMKSKFQTSFKFRLCKKKGFGQQLNFIKFRFWSIVIKMLFAECCCYSFSSSNYCCLPDIAGFNLQKIDPMPTINIFIILENYCTCTYSRGLWLNDFPD